MDEYYLKTLGVPERARVADAREALADAVADVRKTGLGVGADTWSVMGTPELVPAFHALAQAQTLDDKEVAARQVSHAFTVDPGYLYSSGMDDLAFGTAVLMLRLQLHELDAAVNVARGRR